MSRQELEPIDDGAELDDHPDDLTEEEAARGQETYLAVDDLDDESDGLSS